MEGVGLAELSAVVRDLGVIGVLVFILYGGYKRLWVWGWHYEQAIKERDQAIRERDEYKQLTFSGTRMLEEIVAKGGERATHGH